ncbi:MAG TPA: hypothetical protein VF160_16335 [Candidatus Dormibacteraeota bacterium]
MQELEDLYDHYRRHVEADNAHDWKSFDPTGSPWEYVIEAVAAWRTRYGRQRDLIDRLPDLEVRRTVMQRGLDADLAVPIPDWTPEEWDVYNLVERNQPPDQPRVTGLHQYGPSLRALWARAKASGADHPDAWRAIVEWARRPPSRADFPEPTFTPRPAPPPPPPARVFPPPPPDLDAAALLPRYLAGEREQVWADLVGLGAQVRDPRFEPHARAVAAETMRRARRNVETLVARLRGLGYQFWDGSVEWRRRPTMRMWYAGSTIDIPNPWASVPEPARSENSVFTPAGPELPRAAAELQLPIAVQAWFDEVGEVDFSGRHPQLCHFVDDPEYRGVDADPLLIFLEPSLVMEEGLVISLAPAEKSAQAAGEQVDDFLSIPLSSRGADAVLEGDAENRTFVEYLRRSFEWGGFPGWDGAPDPPRDLLRSLTDGLEPI